ncbi:histone-lysine N-methyltransferase SUVR5 isoform X2 [Alnus glutinosa]|uniref:histone-lysine N-methyltransferase SUVR5 isoform X2 n=1 Tax=Alnus glutinosa TaxID=3517 RepID=UPI002D795068|nr:histone-lysine N-methyltransferase SUVR5 isoform X2 [Alnus glutinosa]
MEVLPCSGVKYVGEADCPQPSSGTAFTYDGESNNLEHGKQDQLADGRLDDLLLTVDGPQIEKQGEVQETVDELPTSEGHCSGASYCGSHDFEDDDVNTQSYCTEPCMVSENSHIIVDTIEGELPNNREEESSLSEPTWLEGDESVALWVKALMETARDVMVWKEFAMEASRCNGYSELGRMLLKLQKMILQRYINSDWLHHSFHSWTQRCQNAQSAESIEMLKEELFDSILWNAVNSLWDSPVQPTLGSEWKTWKHEVMKWFSTSHPISSGGDLQQQTSDDLLTTSLQLSRKRPKLEVRRAEAHASQVETIGSGQAITLEIDSAYFNGRDTVTAATSALEPCKEDDIKEVATPTDTPTRVPDKWDDIVVEPGNSELIEAEDVELTPANEVGATISLEPGSKNRQCIAFIEAKGRQCVRWANDGDVYCCVHLSSRFIGSSAKPERTLSVGTPMCEGTTVLGTRCKHRSLYGSSFCKKHRPQNETKGTSNFPETLKRKHEENLPSSETTECKEIVYMGEVESPLHVDPVSVAVDAFHGRTSLTEKPEHPGKDCNCIEELHCVCYYLHGNLNPCLESPKRHSLYCEKHLPSWLKRARNGKNRIISKEVFIDLLRNCCSQEQRLRLHQACELFYKLFKSILSLRNPVPKEVQFQWAISEASKDFGVGEFFTKLVCTEKERLRRIWGFNADEVAQLSSSVMEEPALLPMAVDGSHDDENTIRCKYCSEEFLDDEALGGHWMDIHKKEAQWLFRGYACAICLDSFTNKKVLETHVQERHHVQFVEQCMLLQCIPCGSHFGNTDELWLHVLSVHPVDFRLSKAGQQHNLSAGEDSPQKLELCNTAPVENNSANLGGFRKLICRFCGLKFDLLPDLGRHHQAAHMGPSLVSSRPSKRGIRYYAYRLKSGRLSRPRNKKGLAAASYRIRNRATASMKRRIQASKSLSTVAVSIQPHVTEEASLGRLTESLCSAVAKILFSEIQKTKPRPNNLDILSTAHSACCKVSLVASLEGKYGVLPEHLYLKAAKLCSEHNIRVDWHQEGFICPKGCKAFKDPYLLSPLLPFPHGSVGNRLAHPSDPENNAWEVDECHYIIDSRHWGQNSIQKAVVLCDDISFGQELVPVACIADEGLLDSIHILADNSDGQNVMPWESFTYVKKPLLDQSVGRDTESLQLGCACPYSTCYPETCDHVYLFDNDYDEAKDIYGKPMRGRFPYDDKGRIVLEEGYLVYECNHMCSCSRTCPNRILQNGVRVKLEVFKTEKKGWALRAAETILRGMFVCEYVGEVLDEQEANKRRHRYRKEGCSYLYDIDAHMNDMSRLMEGQVPYVIDATNYGNVSRFINHSCSPNLVNYQVLVESMDSQCAHIGLYASRDIALGEELTFNYRYELLPGEGYPCHCGASNCQGRLY